MVTCAVLLIAAICHGPLAVADSAVGELRAIGNLIDAEQLDSAVERAALFSSADAPQFTLSDTSLTDPLIALGTRLEYDGYVERARMFYGLAATASTLPLADSADVAANALYTWATSLFYAGTYLQADVFCEQSLVLWRRTDSPRVLDALIQLGSIVLAEGRGEASQNYYDQAIAYCREHYVPQSYQMGRALTGVANGYVNAWRFAEAEPLYRQILDIYIDTLGTNNTTVAAIHINLGIVYGELHKYDRATEELETAADIMRNADPPRLAGLSNALVNLGNYEAKQGKTPEAIGHYTEGLALQRDVFGRDSPWTLLTATQLAHLLLREGRLSEAASLEEEALRLVDSTMGPHNTHAAFRRLALATVRLAQRRYADADRLCHEAVQTYQQFAGPVDPEKAEAIEVLSHVERCEGHYDSAAAYAESALAMRLTYMGDHILPGAERDALLYSSLTRNALNALVTSVTEGGHEILSAHAIDLLLTAKGCISDAMLIRHQFFAQTFDSVGLQLYRAYEAAVRRQSQIFVAGPSTPGDPAYDAALDSLWSEVTQREAALGHHFGQNENLYRVATVDHNEITAALPPATALVEYLHFAVRDTSQFRRFDQRYAAMVLRPDRPARILSLGSATLIDSLVIAYQQHFKAIAEGGRMPGRAQDAAYAEIAHQLYAHVWRPVAQLVNDYDQIFIAPDGQLNRISFGTLLEDDNRYLIERHTLQYLSAARDLLRLRQAVHPGRGLLAVADPDFVAPVANPAGSASEWTQRGGAVRVLRGVNPCAEMTDYDLYPLPGTRYEVAQVDSLWELEYGEPYQSEMGAGATEEFVKTSAPGKRAAHFATHAYFLPTHCAPDQPMSYLDWIDQGIDLDNPMLKSGLFLAGCAVQADQRDTTTSEDGVLTAAEIASLNLSGMQFVVLSACETGKGELYNGEGVYGLRRAFHVAGVRTVISALWSIADQFTAPMMPTIYAHSKEPLPDRLRRSQLDWINRLRAHGLSDHPFTWGAFIAEGDWR